MRTYEPNEEPEERRKSDPIEYAYKKSCISPRSMFRESMKEFNRMYDKNVKEIENESD